MQSFIFTENLKRLTAVLCFCMAPAFHVSGQNLSFTVDALCRVGRIDHLAPSPDGEWLAFSYALPDTHAGTGNTDVYIIQSRGGSWHQLTTWPGYDGQPLWSPDGSLLAFISDRSGSRQIHVLPMQGGEARQMTSMKPGIIDFKWSPLGHFFAFTIMDTSSSFDASRCEYGHTGTSGQDGLYRPGPVVRQRLFIMDTAGGQPREAASGIIHASFLQEDGGIDFTFSPDEKQIVFAGNTSASRFLTINTDLYTVRPGSGAVRRLTRHLSMEKSPVFSRDGQYLAYVSMRRTGHPNDQYDLMLRKMDTGETQNLTQSFDLDVLDIVWSHDSDRIYFTALNQGRRVIYACERKKGKIKGLIFNGFNSRLCLNRGDNTLFYVRSAVNQPPEICSCNEDGEHVRQLTFLHQAVTQHTGMNALEEIWIPAEERQNIHAMILKPPFFEPARVYPSVVLLPAGWFETWGDRFFAEWNPQILASAGYVVVMINPRGCKGYGQAYCDGSSANWGAQPFRDVMACVEHLAQTCSWLDPQRIAAAGTFFGGFLINWIEGHTNQFRCLVSQEGISNPWAWYGQTSMPALPAWEFQSTPYENSRNYERWFPLKFAKEFKTPMLLIHRCHNELVPTDQSIQMFTALQRHDVPSRLFILTGQAGSLPSGSELHLFWDNVLDWLGTYLKSETDQ